VTVLVEDELQGLGEESSTVWVNFVGAKTICFWHIVAAGFWTRRMRRLRSASQRAFWNTPWPKPSALADGEVTDNPTYQARGKDCF
jgi:hypothetical protein